MPRHKRETYERYAQTIADLHKQAETEKAVKYQALREHRITPRTFKSLNQGVWREDKAGCYAGIHRIRRQGVYIPGCERSTTHRHI